MLVKQAIYLLLSPEIVLKSIHEEEEEKKEEEAALTPMDALVLSC